MVSRDVSSHLRGVQGQGGIGSQLVIGGHDVAAQPGINRLLAGEQLPKPISCLLTRCLLSLPQQEKLYTGMLKRGRPGRRLRRRVPSKTPSRAEKP